MKKSLELLLFKPISSGATYLIKNETIKSALTLFCIGWITVRGLYLINGIHVKAWQSIHISYLDTFVGFNLSSYLIDFTYRVNDTLRMYKNDDIRMYNFNCITDTIVEVITTCNTYTLLTVHLL